MSWLKYYFTGVMRKLSGKDLIDVRITYRRGHYSYGSESGLEAQRSFLNWLRIFMPEAYVRYIKHLQKSKPKGDSDRDEAF